MALEYLTTDLYRRRTAEQDPLVFQNDILNTFIFYGSMPMLTHAGILQKAQNEWRDALDSGRVPQVDQYGHESIFGSFEHFEDYVWSLYVRLSTTRKQRISQHAGKRREEAEGKK